MLGVVITSALAGLVLLVTERAAKEKKLSLEVSRKIPHILIALAVASWPFFVSMDTVAVLGLWFTAAALLVRILNLFPHSRFVERNSWGEVLFGIAIVVCALIDPGEWIFAAAMLYMGIADSVAAIVGSSKGKHSFIFIGHIKSIEGSAAFIVAAFLITFLVLFISPVEFEIYWPIIIWLPFAASVIEATSPFGLDNLLLPVFVTVVLNCLQSLS